MTPPPPPSPLSTETIATIRRKAVNRASHDLIAEAGVPDADDDGGRRWATRAASYAIESCIREFAALTEGVLRARDRGTETKGEGM